MLFFDWAFLFAFLPITLLGYFLLPDARRNAWLLAASLVFYGATSLEFLPLLAGSIVVDWVAGARVAASERPAVRRAWLIASLSVNLGLLGFFKYAGLVTSTLRELFGPAVPLIVAPLPVGISFYTFQSMSYTIDVYRREVKPVRSLVDFAMFVTLFPQLIAGPIVRFSELAAQVSGRTHDERRAATGLVLLVVGMAKKLLVADTLALWADPIFARGAPGLLDGWASMLLFSGQIYFDFSGYSDMAVGLGRLFGFELPANFDAPYQATSFSDFWRRWHMTLSRWLRDYLYVPLGGNRAGPARTYVNLLVTMLLGGLWHGASWTFVLWGAAHGLLLAVERRLGPGNPLLRLPAAARAVVVFLVVTLVWVPFRLESVALVERWLGAMLLGAGGLGSVEPLALACIAAVLVLVWAFRPTSRWEIEPTGRVCAATCALFLAALFVGSGRVTGSPFLYYRF